MTTQTRPPNARWPILRVFASWRMAVVLLTGFSSGLPLGLTGKTLQNWLASEKVDLSLVTLLGAVAWPYTLKFLWSPLMDRFVPPFLGRRRGWMVVSQVALVGGIVAMAAVGLWNLWVLSAVALLVAFFSASQDICVDAYRTEILLPDELGAGAGLYVLGYRTGLIVSVGLAMVLADHLSWPAVYLLMAAAMLVGIVTTLLAPEPSVPVAPPQTLAEAVVLPFAEFLRRRGAIEMLLFILLYKFDWAMVDATSNLFMLALGFTKTEIGLVVNGGGLVATIAGAMIGGAVVTRLGIHRSLWTFGLLQSLAGMSFTALAVLGRNHSMMVAAIIVENTCTGMATAAFVGFIMSLCNKRFTATQFALLTSLMAMSRTLAGLPSGWAAKHIGWPAYYVLATVIAVPGLLLLLRFRNWQDGTGLTAGNALRGTLSSGKAATDDTDNTDEF